MNEPSLTESTLAVEELNFESNLFLGLIGGGVTMLISAILWGIVYPGLGYLGGASWQKAQSLSVRFGLLILVALAVTIAHHWLRRSLHLNRRDADAD